MRHSVFLHFLLFSIVLYLPFMASALGIETIDFNRDVRPILADKCLACHGADATHVEAGLRLDQFDSATSVLESGDAAIIVGNPQASELVRRIHLSDKDDLQMPPKRSHKSLSTSEKQLLEQWIAQGAVYKKHWAFVAVTRPDRPHQDDQNWGVNAIDDFVISRLQSEGLSPSPEATRATLARRASLDITGLPPSIAEVDAFVNDPEPTTKAFEKVVDRLLASPRYSERMTMWWLDGARYADSNGFQSDDQRYMHEWRDWVLKAFSSNMPFDQFTLEQLAGDLLPDATLEQKIATGFNRNNRQNSEGGLIAEEWRIEGVIDRVEATSAVWMALTIGCARCHDHKYDPISQKEMYQFFSFFNNVPESGVAAAGNTAPTMRVPRPEDAAKLTELEAAIVTADAGLLDAETKLVADAETWATEAASQLLARENVWNSLDGVATSSGGATLMLQSDGSYLVTGPTPANDVYTLSVTNVEARTVSAFQLDAIPHSANASTGNPAEGFGRVGNGNIVLGEFEADVTLAGPEKEAKTTLKFARAFADYSQPNWDIASTIDGNNSTGWALDGNDVSKRVTRHAVFVLAAPVTLPAGSTLAIRLKQEALGDHNFGQFRLSATDRPEVDAAMFSPLPPGLMAALAVLPPDRSEEQRQAIVAHYRALPHSPVAKATVTRDAARKAKVDFENAIPTVMVMQETPQPRDCFVLVRGQYDKPGEKVTAALPAALPPLPQGSPNNRLGLAQWLVDPSHPLTARVQVNRFWELFFGTGIVKSSENLGMQSQYPSHPELLDWLATEYIASGWNTKAILKTILMSATYRQSSIVSSELLAKDPENRLLARGPRFRLQAELVRDNALAISGLLVNQIGGPPVRPYQPDGIWDEINVYGNLRNYQRDKGTGLYRRSLYSIWKRTNAPPNMLIFDMPGREMCVVRRSRTNTPLQALSLLNEVTYVEAARGLAERMLLEGGVNPAERIQFAFHLATARPATERELKTLLAGLSHRQDSFKANPDAAKQLLGVGDKPTATSLDPAELAAYTITASVILNLDETVTKE